jgi:hypothetical protein
MTMTAIDLQRLRLALRQMSRGHLLKVAERAVELVSGSEMHALVGDFVRLDEIAATESGAVPLLDEVRRFHATSLAGEYYEDFDVDSKNCMEMSKGTDAFIAEFDRLVRRCILATNEEPWAPVREAFELLFALLRRIDECRDDVIFFADEAGSWQVGVDWGSVLPGYFRCLADTASAEEFAREVDRTVSDFVKHDRPRHLAAALRVANADQETALLRLAAREHGHPDGH